MIIINANFKHIAMFKNTLVDDHKYSPLNFFKECLPTAVVIQFQNDHFDNCFEIDLKLI